jgi:hypothetical protein
MQSGDIITAIDYMKTQKFGTGYGVLLQENSSSISAV